VETYSAGKWVWHCENSSAGHAMVAFPCCQRRVHVRCFVCELLSKNKTGNEFFCCSFCQENLKHTVLIVQSGIEIANLPWPVLDPIQPDHYGDLVQKRQVFYTSLKPGLL
jgi:hypothetical protein